MRINPILRMVLNRFINYAMDSFAKRQERKAREEGKSEEDIKRMRQTQKRAKRAIRMGRRIGRF